MVLLSPTTKGMPMMKAMEASMLLLPPPLIRKYILSSIVFTSQFLTRKHLISLSNFLELLFCSGLGLFKFYVN
jgi:hypothetical protein